MASDRAMRSKAGPEPAIRASRPSPSCVSSTATVSSGRRLAGAFRPFDQRGAVASISSSPSSSSSDGDDSR